MTTRWGRFARGWLVALFSTLVAAASHTIAGGSSPSAVSLVVALAFAGVTCVALTGKSVSLVRVASSVGVSQFAFHALFSTFNVSDAAAQTQPAPHVHGSVAALVEGSALVEGPASMTHHTDGWMWLGHAVAALVTVVALRYGEGAFWRLRAIAALFVCSVFATPPVVPLLPRVIRRPLVVGDLFLPRICAILRVSLGLRGPPVPSFR